MSSPNRTRVDYFGDQNLCTCGHPQSDHLYGDYRDADVIKRKHQGECSQCGCQGYC